LQIPEQGVPSNPEGWLMTAARNRQKNVARAGDTRRKAEPELVRRFDLPVEEVKFPDNRLRLMFACAHPAIDAAAHAPLILQTILGFEAERIARVFLTEPAAMSQRLVRAKVRIRDAGLRFELPAAKDAPERLAGVLDAVYASFGQGWDGLDLPDAPESLAGGALWLARLIVALMPDEPEPKRVCWRSCSSVAPAEGRGGIRKAGSSHSTGRTRNSGTGTRSSRPSAC
jgi:RNA polymerase sigma-70 factor (ECF subfamily)